MEYYFRVPATKDIIVVDGERVFVPTILTTSGPYLLHDDGHNHTYRGNLGDDYLAGQVICRYRPDPNLATLRNVPIEVVLQQASTGGVCVKADGLESITVNQARQILDIVDRVQG